VAKAFKIIGVIENDPMSCTRFYPKHFSHEGDDFLRLKEGVTIDNERVVDMGLDEFSSVRGAPSEMSHLSMISLRSARSMRSNAARYSSHISCGKMSVKSVGSRN